MADQTLDWTQFTRRIIIHKPIEQAYQAWTQSGLVEQWFLDQADFKNPSGQPRTKQEPAQKGDRYAWKWHGWGSVAEGEVTAANGKDAIAFTFGTAGVVSVQLTETDRGTEIELVQKDIPDDDQGKRNYYNGCSLGWSFWMVNLKAWLEHGITLNETGINFTECSVFEFVNG